MLPSKNGLSANRACCPALQNPTFLSGGGEASLQRTGLAALISSQVSSQGRPCRGRPCGLARLVVLAARAATIASCRWRRRRRRASAEREQRMLCAGCDGGAWTSSRFWRSSHLNGTVVGALHSFSVVPQPRPRRSPRISYDVRAANRGREMGRGQPCTLCPLARAPLFRHTGR